MGFFTDHKQYELDKAAQHLYNQIVEFTGILDQTGGIISPTAKISADKLENAILDLYALFLKDKDSHRRVIWAGQRMNLGGLFPMLILIIEDDIEKPTGYRFSRLNGILR